MATAYINAEGQLALPNSVRVALGVPGGGRVEIVEYEPGEFAIVAAGQDANRLKGILYQPGMCFSLEEIEAAISGSAVEAAK